MVKLVAGVDEVGMGPLAGPVVAAAVILNPLKRIDGLRDSKQLTPERREVVFARIMERALAIGIGKASVYEIATLNIYHANLLAMQRAVANLSITPQLMLIDGRAKPTFKIPTETIIKGDQLIPAISAASIIAKVTRDAEMKEWHDIFPEYNFAKHKGYATKEHRALLQKWGPCPLHRAQFISDLVMQAS